MLKRAGQISSLDYMRTVLQYYNPPLNPFNEWCQLMKPYHYLHPGANYRIFAKPFLKGQLNQCNGHLGHADTLIPFKEMYNLLKDRLFTTWFDRWTVKKFIWLCKASLKIQDAEQKIKFTKIIEASELHEFIQLRRKEIDEEILLEIKNNYEHYDHDTIMSLLGRLQEIHMMLEKVCQVLDFVQKVINNFGVDRQAPNDDYEVPDKTQSTDVVVDEEELINETNLAIEEYEENGTNSASEEYEANETNSVDKLIRDEEEAPKEKKSRIRKHTNLADVLVNNKEKHKKKKKKGRINREPRFY
ncbi:hypothetical protein BDC45DRAFT_293413 [Circinella umbellata]|nr:hypothetical protein BDC45DRAFT_293413 [Circinella umbellata]